MPGQFEFGRAEESWTYKSPPNPEHPTYWFIGDFIPQPSIRSTNLFEVKWGVHQPNDPRLGRENEPAPLTVSVLIKGRIRYWIRATGAEEWTERTLQEVGEFVIWETGVDHKYLALESDTIVLTIRKKAAPAAN